MLTPAPTPLYLSFSADSQPAVCPVFHFRLSTALGGLCHHALRQGDLSLTPFPWAFGMALPYASLASAAYYGITLGPFPLWLFVVCFTLGLSTVDLFFPLSFHFKTVWMFHPYFCSLLQRLLAWSLMDHLCVFLAFAARLCLNFGLVSL